MSSALAERTLRSPPGPSASATLPAVPNAPNTMLASDRFIALPIIWVSRLPDAPTRVPEMMRTLFERTKPVDAVARPVNAFRSEMTTGMSAPPIAITICTPRMRETSTMATSSAWLSWPVARKAHPARIAAKMPPVTSLCPGTVTGFPVTMSWSFPNAIIDPAKLTDPTTAEKRIEMMILVSTWPARPTVSW